MLLDLPFLVRDVYDAHLYGRTLNYAEPCDPPLADDEGTWANEMLRQAGKR